MRAFCSFNPLRPYAIGELTGCHDNPQLRSGLKLHFGNSDVDLDNPEHVAQVRKVFEAANRHPLAYPKAGWEAFQRLPLTEAEFAVAGAPQGSEITHEGKVVRQFGRQQCLAIYLDGTSLPDQVYASLDFDQVVNDLGKAAGPDSYHGCWQGPEETGLYFLGSDAEDMFTRVEPLLRTLPIGQNARVVVGHGKESLQSRTIRMPRH